MKTKEELKIWRTSPADAMCFLAFKLLNEGMKSKQVGEQLGVPWRHVYGLWCKADRHYDALRVEKDWTDGLSTRATNVIVREGLKNKDEVIDAYKTGCLSASASCREKPINFGAATSHEIGVWLGLVDQKVLRPTPGQVKAALAVLARAGVKPPE